MDANTYYLERYLNEVEQALKIQSQIDAEADKIYQDWLGDPPAAEVLAAMWDLNDQDLRLLRNAIKQNNENDAGRVFLAIIKKSLMHAATITASECK
jgi:hypothetical protein